MLHAFCSGSGNDHVSMPPVGPDARAALSTLTQGSLTVTQAHSYGTWLCSYGTALLLCYC